MKRERSEANQVSVSTLIGNGSERKETEIELIFRDSFLFSSAARRESQSERETERCGMDMERR